MKNVIMFLVFAAYLIVPASATSIDLLSYKDGGKSADIIFPEDVITRTWKSDAPTCLKDGAKILGVNEAFRKQRLGYGDCSMSPAKRRIHAARGYRVTVFRLSELPDNMIKSIKAN